MPRNRVITKRTIKNWSGGESNLKKPNVQLQKLHSSRINQGMITSIDSADIPNEALQYAKNVKVLFDKVSRRDGLISFGPTKPDSNTILKMANLKQPDGNSYIYRFSPTSIYRLSGGSWVPVVETVPIIGSSSDRINVATVLDIFAFTNNGSNNVQWIDPVADVSDDLIDNIPTNLPNTKFRYCTGFYNRLVMAALRDENEILLAWTGEYGSKNTTKKGLEDLDPSVNETSGFSPLIDSPNDTSDFIKGIFGFTSIMIILREKSIWLANKQASFTNPFNAYAAIPGVGCDTPFTAKITKYGLAWFDRRSRSIYHYTPGSMPEDLGHPIENSIICNIGDLDLVFGIYDHVEDAYSICIPSTTSNIVQVWTFYFQDKAWTYNEYINITSFDEVELLAGYTSMDELIGTFDNLSGSMDSLSATPTLESKRIFGFSNGSLAIPDSNVDDDLGIDYETNLISKAFVMPGSDIYVANIVIEVEVKKSCVLEIWYAPDGGADPNSSLILGDAFNMLVLNKPQIITLRKVIHSRRCAFAVKANTGKFEILSYEIWITGAGDINMMRQVS